MIDLHLHSTFSDGTLTPDELARAARKAGLTAAALTDHDSISGVPAFIDACARESVLGIPGVEISVDYAPGTIHILGYYIDLSSDELIRHIERLKSSRTKRNADILKKINNLGLALTEREVNAFAGEGNVGRLHFAQALVARGYVASTQEAFDRYLARGKSGYVERDHMTPRGGVEMITHAGGLAVLAHPFTIELSLGALEKLTIELVAHGLQGIEVYYPQHNPNAVRNYLALARKLRLVATGGTDYHGTATPEISIGRGFGALHVPDSVLQELDERRRVLAAAGRAGAIGGKQGA